METDKLLSGDKSSNLTNLVSGIIISAAAVLPLAGCDEEYSGVIIVNPPPRVYYVEPPPQRVYVVSQPRYYPPQVIYITPQPRYYPQQRVYHSPQRPFNNGPYGNSHRDYPQQRHPQGPRGGGGHGRR